MPISAIEKELMQYVAQMDERQQKSLLDMIKVFVEPTDDLSSTISIEEYNKELDEAEAEFERGEYITHDAMLQQIKQW
jgi:hypothetical protein